jgi:hypothetical protein
MNPIDDPGTEEELDPGNKRRLRVDLFVGGVVLIGVVLIGKALAGDHRNPGPAASSPPIRASSDASAEPAASGPSSVFVTRADGQRRLVPGLPRRVGDDPAACPPLLSCFTETGGPGPMLEPVLSRFPDANVVAVASVRLRDDPWVGSLWFRTLRFRVNGGELSIRVIARGLDARADSGRVGDLLFVRTTLEQYELTVQAPAATGLSIDDLRRIAADDRLLTT